MAPLYEGRSPHEVLAIWQQQVAAKGFDLLRTYWRQRHPDDFDRFWETGLRSGVIEAASAPLPTPSVREVAIPPASDARAANVEIGRASCRERVCQYG